MPRTILFFPINIELKANKCLGILNYDSTELAILPRENENFFSEGLWKRTDEDLSGLLFDLGDDKMISCVPSSAPRLDDSEPFVKHDSF